MFMHTMTDRCLSGCCFLIVAWLIMTLAADRDGACQDDPQCSEFKETQCNQTWMKNKCKKMCKLCPGPPPRTPDPTSTPPTTTTHTADPPNNPTITVVPWGAVLYEGDQHTASCSVAGGNPPADSLTLTCQGQPKEEQRTSNDVIVTRVAFTVKRNNTICTCTAYGPHNTGWPSPVFSVITRTIYGKPNGAVEATCPASVAEGQTLTCSCKSKDLGVPAGRLMWVGIDNRNIVTGGDGQHTLALSRSGSRQDNGRTFTCKLEWNGTVQEEYSATATAVVIFAPTSPLISRVSPQFPYEGETQTVSCSVSGGNPRVASITLTCYGQSQIQRPSGSTADTLTGVFTFIARGQHPTCTCTGNGPEGVAAWSPVSGVVENMTVHRKPSRPEATCPASVAEGRTLTCSCRSPELGVPAGRLMWVGSDNTELATGGVGQQPLELSRSVRRQDNGRTFTCKLEWNGTVQEGYSAAVTAVVIYPPNKPTITVEPRDTVLYERDQHTASCSVEGGNPPADSLTLTCQGQRQTAQRRSYDVIVTNVIFTVQRNETICTCRAYGPHNTGWPIPVPSEITRTIYRPPSTPTITRVGRQAYKERDTALLQCTSNDPGNPTATYMWVQAQGRKFSANSSRVTISDLTWEDNGLEISCRAENAFTRQKGSLLTGVHRLDVQYDPRISFQPLDGNDCSGAASGSCDVKEGGRIYVKCTAHANPNVTTVYWEGFRSDVLHVTARRDHTSFKCLANNGRNTRSETLHVNVTYQPGAPQLSLTSQGQDLIDNSVKENRSVTLTCTGTSRPKPTLRLQRVERDRAKDLVSTTGTTNKDDVTVITYNLPSARCEDAGRYQCVVSNNEKLTSQADLLVNCGPRLNDTLKSQQNVTYSGSPKQLTFQLVAYPLPSITVTPAFRSSYDTKQSDQQDTGQKFNGTCEAPGEVKHHVVCSVWIQGVTSQDTGLYTLTVDNSEGRLDTLSFNLMVDDSSSSWLMSVLAAGGAVLVVILIVACIVVILFRLRKQKQKSRHARPVQRHARNASGDSGNDEDAAVSGLRDVPQAEIYDVVHKKTKPKTQHASPQFALSEQPGTSGDVYAMVNKTPSAALQPATAASTSKAESEYANFSGASQAIENAPLTIQAPNRELYTTVIKPGSQPTTSGQGAKMPSTKPKPKKKPSATKRAVGRTTEARDGGKAELRSQVNQDGLVYTSVDFSEFKDDPEKSLPARKVTEYVAIDFRRSATSETEK